MMFAVVPNLVAYEGIVAIMDNVPDSQGHTLGSDVTISNPLPVTYNFDDYQTIGSAKAWVEGDKVLVEVFVDSNLIPQGLVETLVPVIDGKILACTGFFVEKWRLEAVALTLTPCDHRLPKLKRKYE